MALPGGGFKGFRLFLMRIFLLVRFVSRMLLHDGCVEATFNIGVRAYLVLGSSENI